MMGCGIGGGRCMSLPDRADKKTLRREFKKCLMDGWLSNYRIYAIAEMVMIDHGIEIMPSTVENFLRDIGVPQAMNATPSVYIATFYPKTSAMLFSGVKDVRVFWREKAIIPDKKSWVNKAARDKREVNRFLSIRIVKKRDLTKWHDWKTVK